VRFYWLERGEYSQCESALELPYDQEMPVIAFKEEWNSYLMMDTLSLNKESIS